MPIYEYLCRKCGEFEVSQRITDDPLTRCPTCRAKVKKLISNTSFQLKGSGWYATDYARKSEGKAAESGESKPEAKNGSETGTTSDAKDKKETKKEAKNDGGAKAA